MDRYVSRMLNNEQASQDLSDQYALWNDEIGKEKKSGKLPITVSQAPLSIRTARNNQTRDLRYKRAGMTQVFDFKEKKAFDSTEDIFVLEELGYSFNIEAEGKAQKDVNNGYVYTTVLTGLTEDEMKGKSIHDNVGGYTDYEDIYAIDGNSLWDNKESPAFKVWMENYISDGTEKGNAAYRARVEQAKETYLVQLVIKQLHSNFVRDTQYMMNIQNKVDSSNKKNVGVNNAGLEN